MRPSSTGEETRYFARILLKHLPSWLEDEIRSDCLSICDWGCAEGEAVDLVRSHFPLSRIRGVDPSPDAIRRARSKFGTEYFLTHDVLKAPLPATFDVVSSCHVLQDFPAPWQVLGKVAAHATRHVVLLVPYGEDHVYNFNEATISTRVEPDFVLSSCKVIESGQDSILLVYSRPDFMPKATVFEWKAGQVHRAQGAESGGVKALSDELGMGSAAARGLTRDALERRTAEIRKASARETALEQDLANWRRKAAALEQQLEQKSSVIADLRAAQQRAQEDHAAKEKQYAAENQLLSSAAEASARETAALRRLVTELQSSLSWKITGPLRYLTKPLFRALASPAPAQAPVSAPRIETVTPDAPPAAIAPDPIETIVLPALRQARSVAVVSCALPYSSMLNHRPISCARYFADQGHTVLFVEIWGTAEEPRHKAGEEVYPGILAIPLDDFAARLDAIAPAARVTRSYLCTIPHRGLLELVNPLRAAGYHIHYDIMDDWEEFYRADQAEWYALAVERELVTGSDTVSAVSDKLVEKFQDMRSDIAVVRNGYQPSALACEPFIAAHTPMEKPKTVGYFGHFSDGWFDWDTIFYAARKRPEVHFELIGWGLSETARVRLQEYPNVHFVGLVPQNNLHRHAKGWWAAMIPFRPSVLSAAVDPLKIYEYLHLGLNSIVTGISGIAAYPMVYYAYDADGFVAALDQLPDRPDQQSLAEAAEFLKMCVWEARLGKLRTIMEEQRGF